MDRAEELVSFTARPNFKAIGARFGSRTQQVAGALRALTPGELAAFHTSGELRVMIDGETVEIGREELALVQESKGELVVEASGGYTVALDPEITPDLRAEGLAREVVNRVQRLRKDAGLEVSDRIRLGVQGAGELVEALQAHGDFVAGETLAVETRFEEAPFVEEAYDHVRGVDLDGEPATIGLTRAGDGGGAA